MKITYFFGFISVVVICSIPGTRLPIVGADILDHPSLLKSADGVKITLDKIDAQALSNPAHLRAELSARLGVKVVPYQITVLVYITDMARINLFFHKP